MLPSFFWVLVIRRWGGLAFGNSERGRRLVVRILLAAPSSLFVSLGLFTSLLFLAFSSKLCHMGIFALLALLSDSFAHRLGSGWFRSFLCLFLLPLLLLFSTHLSKLWRHLASVFVDLFKPFSLFFVCLLLCLSFLFHTLLPLLGRLLQLLNETLLVFLIIA